MIEFTRNTPAGSEMEAFINAPHATIARLHVIPKERRSGIASDWFAEFHDLCLRSNVTQIITLINTDNPRDQQQAEALVEQKFGFKRIGSPFEETPTFRLIIR